MDAAYRIVLFLFILMLPAVSGVHGASQEQTWTNENNESLFNGPDKPTQITFTSCMKILSITTNHWNYGQGDTPGKLSLVHEDGTVYGPWRAFGVNGSGNEPNAYWTFNPGEVVKAGTYLVSDTNPQTWVQNDASDNRGMATIISVPSPCLNEAGDIPADATVPIEPTPTVPVEAEGGIELTPGEIDPSTLSGGAYDRETVPILEQVGFRLVNDQIHGGDPVYALLRVKNTGYRALEDGYITIRLISTSDIATYRAGMAKLPVITAGEERDIPLIIPTSGPDENTNTSAGNTLFCSDYLLEGTINELMQGGYFQRRGDLLLPRQKLLTVTGCCQEPHTQNTVRGCRE